MKMDAQKSGGAAVVVTGCSSGIGRALALGLAGEGYTVFATVRRASDAEALSGLGYDNLIALCPLDLANLDQIRRAVETVRVELAHRDLRGVYGLINNAGAGSPAPIELMELDKFHTELQARVLGSVAMVQAFLPLLREAAGRIVWILTPGLIPTPFVAGIHACDFAINCIARTLELELKPWNIPIIMVRCGGIRTPAGMRTTSDVAAVLANTPRERARLYEAALTKWSAAMAQFDQKRTDPRKVVEVALAALKSKRPKRRYSVGHMARAAAILEDLPPSMADWILGTRF